MTCEIIICPSGALGPHPISPNRTFMMAGCGLVPPPRLTPRYSFTDMRPKRFGGDCDVRFVWAQQWRAKSEGCATACRAHCVCWQLPSMGSSLGVVVFRTSTLLNFIYLCPMCIFVANVWPMEPVPMISHFSHVRTDKGSIASSVRRPRKNTHTIPWKWK